MEAALAVSAGPTRSPSRPQLSPPGATAMTTPPLMAFKLEKTPMYSSPPPASSTPENNTCKLIEYRGAKVAAFSVDGRELICLPQAFELFLKHLVGGLHTVYTKLKRLEIVPVVCNVEQVRILRGLGAIQPGVNRCKLISPKEFDVLYDDCTNSSARPGRPPKRSAIMTANPDTLEKLKKSRMENGEFPFPAPHMPDPKKASLFGNGYHYPPHLAPIPFMPMAHPAMMSMAMAGHLGMRQEGMPFHQPDKEYHTHNAFYRAAEPKEDRPTDIDRPQDKPLDLNIKSDDNHNIKRHPQTDHSTGTSTPSDLGHHLGMQREGTIDDDDLDGDDDDSLDDIDDGDDLDDDSDLTSSNNSSAPAAKTVNQNLAYASQLLNATETAGVSSIETLLLNIQGLLKVAAENAKHQERQIKYEKAELKLQMQREKETKEQLEKQLSDEQKNRGDLQRRLKKERKARRKLQEQLEMMLKQRPLVAEEHNGQSLQQSAHSRIPDSINDEPPVLESRPPPPPPPPAESPRSNLDSSAPSGLKGYMDSILGPKSTCNGSASATNGFMHSPSTPGPAIQAE